MNDSRRVDRGKRPGRVSVLPPRRPAEPSGIEQDVHFHLTPRDREIVALLIADRTCKEIATILGISNRTASHYVERLKLRFRKSTLHGLVAEVLKLGLLGFDEG